VAGVPVADAENRTTEPPTPGIAFEEAACAVQRPGVEESSEYAADPMNVLPSFGIHRTDVDSCFRAAPPDCRDEFRRAAVLDNDVSAETVLELTDIAVVLRFQHERRDVRVQRAQYETHGLAGLPVTRAIKAVGVPGYEVGDGHGGEANVIGWPATAQARDGSKGYRAGPTYTKVAALPPRSS
jgi:hypothetical protein